MTTQELLRAIAYLTALEQQQAAIDAAVNIPDWLDIVDVLRAVDGCEQLARALNNQRRNKAA